MSNPYDKIKRMLTEEEKEKLKFTTEDHKAVYQKILKSNSQMSKGKFRVQKAAAYILTPVAIVILAFIILMQTPIKQQVVATVSFLGSLFSEYGDEGLKEAVKKNPVQQINQTVDNNGVKITFNEIFYDGARISVAYSIESHSGKLKGRDLNILFFNMKVDGKAPVEYGFSGTVKDKKIGNKYMKVQNIDIKQTLPDKFNLDLSIQELTTADIGERESVKGDWTFSLPVKRIGETYQYAPNVSKHTDLGEIWVKDVTFAPSGMQLEIETKQPKELINKMGYIEYMVLDDKGNEIETIGGSHTSFKYKNDIGTGTTNRLYVPVKKIPRFITIKPHVTGFLSNHEPVEHKVNISEQLPIFLPQGKNGGISIKKIEKKENEIWVHFNVEGDFVKKRKNAFMLINGKEITSESIIKHEGDIDNNERKNQLIKFKTPYSEDLHFVAFDSIPEWIEEWKLKVPIDEKKFVKLESNK